MIKKLLFCSLLIAYSSLMHARVGQEFPINLPEAPNVTPAMMNQDRLQQVRSLLNELGDAERNEEFDYYTNEAISILNQILQHQQDGPIQVVNEAKDTLAKITDNTDQMIKLYEEILESYKQKPRNLPKTLNVQEIRYELALIYSEYLSSLKNESRALVLLQAIVDDYNHNPSIFALNDPLLYQAQIDIAQLLLKDIGHPEKRSQALDRLNKVINQCENSNVAALRQQANEARMLLAETLTRDVSLLQAIIADRQQNEKFVSESTFKKAQEALRKREREETQAASPSKRRSI